MSWCQVTDECLKSLTPQHLARKRRPLRQRLELRAGNLRMAAQPEPAVGRRDHVLAPDHASESHEAIRDELGMLD